MGITALAVLALGLSPGPVVTTGLGCRNSPLLILAQNPADSRSSAESEGAKKDRAQGYWPYCQLKWDDFPVTNTPPEHLLARTQAYIHYDCAYAYRPSSGRYEATLQQIEIRSGLDRNKSWRVATFDRDSEALLRHEQGHLDINEVQAAKLRSKPLAAWPQGSGSDVGSAITDLSIKVRRTIDDAVAAANLEQAQYDNETDHGRNEKLQAEWTSKIKRQLDAARQPG